tara:strand:- start:402 stop:683 length:282 start_codon:yes stop_codon:yes gene_type:complete
VLLTIEIPDKLQQVAFAADIKHILRVANIDTKTYIPGMRDGNKADIGIQAENISLKTLAQIVGRIERSGYSIKNTKGSDVSTLNLSLSVLSPQ